VLDRLIDSEAGWLGGQLEQNARGLAEIDRVEIIPIDDGCRIEACCANAIAYRQLCSIVGYAPSDVVYRACPAHTLNEATDGPDLYDGSGATVTGRESSAGAFFGDQLEAKPVENIDSRPVFFHPQSH